MDRYGLLPEHLVLQLLTFIAIPVLVFLVMFFTVLLYIRIFDAKTGG